MNNLTMVNALRVFALGVLGASWANAAQAEEATAFELAKQGNQFVGKKSKDKIVEIRSDKSAGSLSPQTWHIVYYDPDTAFKAVEVQFVAGRKVKVSRPARVLESAAAENEPLPPEALKVDSDKALAIIRKVPDLEKFKLTASQWKLERRAHDDPHPVWRVSLWGRRDRDPAEDGRLGEIVVSASTGDVLETDLQLDRLRESKVRRQSERSSPPHHFT